MTATERDYYATVVDAARIFGWRVAHFRPALTKHGWRTPVSGDGAGFPDFVLVHPLARRVWWRELKTDGDKPTDAQTAWGSDLIAAGADWRVVHVPSEADAFITELARREPR